MSVFLCDSVQVVKERFEIFTKIWKSGLRLFGFGNKFLQKGNNYEKVVIIWREFQSINDFILENWGACVDTIFGISEDKSGRTDR